MSKVVIVKCESYEPSELKDALSRAFDLLGGIEPFARKGGETTLLKPNMLAADPPEKCSTTHPNVFRALSELLLDAGASLIYGDSPAFHSPPHGAAKKIGIAQVAEELGIELADFENGEDVFYEDALQNKKLYVAKGILDADHVISLPKLKTHGFQKK